MITSEAAHREFRLCAEALIDRPVLTAANDRPLLEKIRRHQPALQSTFGRLTGWRVQAHPEFARLVKTPARAEASHGLPWARGRTDYALLAWVLWYGEHTGGRKSTVSQIAEEIKLRSAGVDDAGLDWTSREQRLAARRVFRGLEEMGVFAGRTAAWTSGRTRTASATRSTPGGRPPGASTWASPRRSWSGWRRAGPRPPPPPRRTARTRSACTAPSS